MPDDLAQQWSRARARLQASVPASTYAHWLAPLQPVALRGRRAYLSAPDAVRPWITRRYGALLALALREAGAAVDDVVLTDPEAAHGPPPIAAPLAADPACRPALTLNRRYSFSSFVIGSSNRLAHASTLAVAERPGEAYNPLFLFGPPGLGKTHLMGAVATYLGEHSPELRVHYTTAETFTNAFLGALHTGSADRFKAELRSVDVLLIDDVQFLEGKERTQEEFFHTFNALYESGRQIILSADRSPQRLSALTGRLRDRFEWGLMVELTSPDLPTRQAVVRKLTEQGDDLAVDDSTVEVIAAHTTENLRRLEGALTRVLAGASLEGTPVSSTLAARVLAACEPLGAEPPLERLKRLTATRLGLTEAELVGTGRSPKLTRGRQLAMYLARHHTDHSLAEIGRAFGGRDHTTVLHAVRRTESRQGADPELDRAIHDIATAFSPPSSPAPR